MFVNKRTMAMSSLSQQFLFFSPQRFSHSLQRFPQFIHSKNTVIGSSADRVCFCMYCVLSDPHRRHCIKEAHRTHYLEASREFVHHVRLVPIGLIRFEHFLFDRFSLRFNGRTRFLPPSGHHRSSSLPLSSTRVFCFPARQTASRRATAGFSPG